MSDERILIIDDDHILSGLLKLTLELEGFAADTAGNGEEGMAFLRSGQLVDLIVLDLVMPKMDGVRFLRTLAQSNLPRPPILIMSSAARGDVTEQQRALGVVGMYRKPLEPKALVERVREALAAERAA